MATIVRKPGLILQRPSLQDVPQSDVEVWKDAFDLIDVEGRGRLTEDELAHLYERLGKTVETAKLTEMIRDVDKTGDGTVDFESFCSMMKRQFGIGNAEFGDDTLQEAFNHFDQDGDGFISSDELRSALFQLFGPMEEEDVADMIKLAAQHSSTGYIDYKTFSDMLNKEDEDEERPADKATKESSVAADSGSQPSAKEGGSSSGDPTKKRGSASNLQPTKISVQQQRAKRYVEENGLESLMTGLMNEILVTQPEKCRIAIFRFLHAKLSDEELPLVEEIFKKPREPKKFGAHLRKNKGGKSNLEDSSVAEEKAQEDQVGEDGGPLVSPRSPRDEFQSFLDPKESLSFGPRKTGEELEAAAPEG